MKKEKERRVVMEEEGEEGDKAGRMCEKQRR